MFCFVVVCAIVEILPYLFFFIIFLVMSGGVIPVDVIVEVDTL